MTEPTLFDRPAALAARDAAIDRVDKSAPAEWAARADRAVRSCALGLAEFTTDAAQQLAGDPPEPRAWGGVMRRARRAGWIEPTDRTEQSGSVRCHGRPKRIWRSLLRRSNPI